MFFMSKIVNAGTVGRENQPTLLKVTCTTLNFHQYLRCAMFYFQLPWLKLVFARDKE